MPRLITPLETGERYHIFNRGVDKRTIFETKNDYLRFYQSLYLFNSIEPIITFKHSQSKFTKRTPLVEIEAYSLLPNHFHLLLIQRAENGISEFMKRIAGGYTSYFNERNKRSGVLFQGRFKRVLIDNDAQYRYVFAYVNENHSVHNIKRPDEIIYSSSLHYQKKIQSKVINIPDSSFNKYNFKEHVAVAKETYARRTGSTQLLLE